MLRKLFLLFITLINVTSAFTQISRTDSLKSASQCSQNALLLIKDQKYLMAIYSLDSAINMYPGNLDLYKERGYCKSMINFKEGAIQDYRRHLLEHPSDFEIRYLTGNLYEDLMLLDSAIVYYTRAIHDIQLTGMKTYDTYYTQRAGCYLDLGRYQDAIGDYDRALALNNKAFVNYAYRGLARIKINNPEKACHDWRVASKNGIKSVDSLIEQHCSDIKTKSLALDKEKQITVRVTQISLNQVTSRTMYVPATSNIGDSAIYTIVDVMPEFPGGEKGLNAFLSKNIIYPKAAADKGLQGTVYATFVVERDGAITNAKVLFGMVKECNDEALRVIRLMPKWIPAQQSGKPVRVQFNLPVRFVIQ